MRVYDARGLAQLHKALGDETRLRIVNLLAHRAELCVCDVESCLEISQSKASRHLVYLKNAGLVEDRRDATWVYYRITRDHPYLRAVVRGIKKALADDETALRDLRRSNEVEQSSSCLPISVAKNG